LLPTEPEIWKDSSHCWKVQSHSTPVLATELRGCSADFLHSGTGYMEITVFVLRLIFLADFSQNFSERALFILKNSITTSVTKISTVEPVTLKKPCLFRADFNHDFLQISVTPTLVNTWTHDGYGSVNITARRCVCDSRRSPLMLHAEIMLQLPQKLTFYTVSRKTANL